MLALVRLLSWGFRPRLLDFVPLGLSKSATSKLARRANEESGAAHLEIAHEKRPPFGGLVVFYFKAQALTANSDFSIAANDDGYSVSTALPTHRRDLTAE